MSLERPARRIRLWVRRASLPWDCLILVFAHCDPDTLAVLGRVSLDVLTATAPMLYEKVEISSFRALARLFSDRTETKEPSRINQLLSLSQIEHLVLTLSTVDISRRFSLSRSNGFGALHLKRLWIKVSSSNPYDMVRSTLLNPLFNRVLPLLNPIRASFAINHPAEPWFDYRGANIYTWTRLEEVEVSGKWVYRYPTAMDGRFLFLGLPFDDAPRWSLRVRADTGRSAYIAILDEMTSNPNTFGLNSRRPGSIILVVDSEATKAEAERTIGVLFLDKWKSIFVVEVRT